MVRKLPLLKAPICNKHLEYPVLIDLEELTQVRPVVTGMFQIEIPRVPLAGRLKHFLPAWKKLTRDKEILNMVNGLKFPFVSEPYQEKISSNQIKVALQQERLVQQKL